MKKQTKTSKVAMYFTLTIFIAVVLLFILAPAGEKKQQSDVEKVDAKQAYIISQEFVKDYLVSPSTADFAFMYDNYTEDPENTFWITSHVDSQNALGAEIRTNYLIGIQYVSGKWSNKMNWKLIEFTVI